MTLPTFFGLVGNVGSLCLAAGARGTWTILQPGIAIAGQVPGTGDHVNVNVNEHFTSRARTAREIFQECFSLGGNQWESIL